MDDVPRYVVGALWCLVVGSFVRELRARRRGAGLGLAVGVLLAGCAFARWHVEALRAARALLRDGGEYDDRVVYKAAVGVAAATVLVVAGWRARGGERRVPRVALLATLGGIVYLTMQTAFLDDVLPAALAAGPGRYTLEATFAVVALVSLLRRPRPA